MKKIGEVWEETLEAGKGYGIVKARDIQNLRENEYVRSLTRFLKPGARVLEAGCGSAKFSLAMAALGFRVVALDYSGQMLRNVELSKRNVEKVFGPVHLETIRGDIECCSFQDDSFDLVFNEGVIEHWLRRDDRIRILNEMKRVSRRFVGVIVPNGRHRCYEYWMSRGYPGYTTAPPMTLYSMEKLSAELREAGLNIRYKNGADCWSFVNFWPRRRILDYPKIILSRCVPMPRSWSSEFGINLVCIGQK